MTITETTTSRLRARTSSADVLTLAAQPLPVLSFRSDKVELGSNKPPREGIR